MGCALDTCRGSDSEANTSEGEREEILPPVTSSLSIPSSVPPSLPPSVPPSLPPSQPQSLPPSLPQSLPPSVQPSVSTSVLSSARSSIQGPSRTLISTDEIETILNMIPPKLQLPIDDESIDNPNASTSGRTKRYIFSSSRKNSKFLAEEDAFLEFQKRRAARGPSTFTIIKRHLFYKSFPPSKDGRKTLDKRMKRQGYGVYVGSKAIFRGNIRDSGSSSGSCASRGVEKSLPVLTKGKRGRNYSYS
nr:uncharacterized protein LOC111508765 [Leptinotarsa decemlineata]